MSNRCDRLRERALTDGENSPNHRAWRIHSRSCPRCRTELFVLDTLDEQARSERQHLGRAELSRLLAEAGRQSRTGKNGNHTGIFGWTLRVACLVAVCLSVSLGLRSADPLLLLNTDATDQATAAFIPDSASGHYAVPVATAASEHAEAIREISGAQEAVRPAPVGTAWELDARLRQLRGEIQWRRELLLKLMERDLGEQMREDVWNATWLHRLVAV